MRIAAVTLLLAASSLWSDVVGAAPRSWIQFDAAQVRERREHREFLQRPQRQPGFAAPQRNEPQPVQTFAPRSEPQAPANAAPPTAPRLSPGDAARRAQQQYGGRVLSVYPSAEGYRVKMLRDGEVTVVSVPNE